MASCHRRSGPAFWFFGLAQPLLDGVKLVLKQQYHVVIGQLGLFLIAPVMGFCCALGMWGLTTINCIVVNFDASSTVVILLIVLSFGIYGVIFAGWACTSKYGLLGAVRGLVQTSYEVCRVFVGFCGYAML